MESIKLSANNITKILESENGEKTCVINGISMDIAEEETVCILGPADCGKSAFMKILGGIESATSGNIVADGQDCGTQLPRALLKKFGFVFQSPNLLPWRTVQGNLRFDLEAMHLKGPEWNKRLDDMLELTGLSKYRKAYPHELADDMRRRVGIARALVHNPEVLLMDRPFGALDAITHRMLTFELLNIRKETRKTIVMATDDVDEALLLAKRVYVFSEMPAQVVAGLDVPIPYEERTPDIVSDSRFRQLRAELNGIVRSTVAKGEGKQ